MLRQQWKMWPQHYPQERSSSDMQKCSAWKIVRSLDMPMNTVNKVIQNILHCYQYKFMHVQVLLSIDLAVKHTFLLAYFMKQFVNKQCLLQFPKVCQYTEL